MTLKPLSFLASRYGRLIIIVAWLLSTLVYLQLNGVVTQLEAAKYIGEAKYYIENGSFSQPRFLFYSTTIFIILISIKISIGLTGAFIIQALLNLFAWLILFKALNKLFNNSVTPIFIILYLLCFSPYQSWVVFLYTESAFFSAVLILLSVLILYKPVSVKNILLIAAALLLTLISRPLGILFGVSVYCYLFYHANKKWKIIIACCSVLFLIVGYYLVNAVFNSVSDWRITQGFEEECIICDMPGPLPYQKLDLAQTGSPAYQLVYYTFHNPSHFLHFVGVKLKYFFLMTRPYYSKAHNYFLLLNVIPVYLLGTWSFFIKGLHFNKSIAIFLTSSIIIFALAISFQCDDYHNRFILSIYPFFVILAARAADHLLSGFFKNNK